ncbi:MAG: glycosyltransferase [Candidatus Abyssobacteria bacterium SURF_5]|uniref:Glycosyltransferase n=1 Tax=Abyssobacteria bacterium (strain SURF_5) TaxID=2093360 RepID=A0A3A4N2I8_ABYX5|nr:MAG: glycosyltransferase [Candidatus Abyssubacteria bacterium SURF_5]
MSSIQDYEPLIGGKAVERIMKKAKPLHDLHVANINSTYYGGGVAEMLSSLTLLMNSVGIKTGWRIIQGSPDFFSITKKFHNALQGGEINLSRRKKEIYEEVIHENSLRNHLTHDMVIIHDPQPLPMINHYRRRGPWIWRCHVDLTSPNRQAWDYLKQFIERYDAVILSSRMYEREDLKAPQVVFVPAINPFSILNREMRVDEIEERLAHYHIPTDLPLVVQISRFDRWKDPVGVIESFKIARKQVDATLVLLGNVATDDPEGAEVYQSLMDSREERIIIMSHQDTALVNALQRKADVVLQKSLREGFGLTVAEAMWKGTPVIGGDVGGIRLQIEDGVNGYLVSSNEEAADRIVRLLRNKDLRMEMGEKARETVKRNFLLTRYLEQYLDLFSSFRPHFDLAR